MKHDRVANQRLKEDLDLKAFLDRYKRFLIVIFAILTNEQRLIVR